MDRALTTEEFEVLSKELQDVLLKHGCDMAVSAKIEFTKRIEDGEKKPE